MKSKFLLLFFIFLGHLNNRLNAQSYQVEITSAKYDTLTGYTSVGNEKAKQMINPYNLEDYFDLGFEFPYFDIVVDSLQFNYDGIVDIEGCEEYPMYLFSADYRMFREFNILGYLKSDFRYKRFVADGHKVFVMEYKDLLLKYKDLVLDPTKSSVNFQLWFWETGTIEIRFGDIYLDENLYKAGYGWKSYSDTSFYPFSMQISNYDLTENISISGDINSQYEVLLSDTWDQDVFGIRTLPKKGTICRFLLKTVNTGDVSDHSQIKPIVYSDNIQFDLDMEMVSIFDISGKKVSQLSNTTNIDISLLKPGIYILQIIDSNKSNSYKFYKN